MGTENREKVGLERGDKRVFTKAFSIHRVTLEDPLCVMEWPRASSVTAFVLGHLLGYSPEFPALYLGFRKQWNSCNNSKMPKHVWASAQHPGYGYLSLNKENLSVGKGWHCSLPWVQSLKHFYTPPSSSPSFVSWFLSSNILIKVVNQTCALTPS